MLEGVEAEFYLEALHSAVDDLEVAEDAEVEVEWRTGDRIFRSTNFDLWDEAIEALADRIFFDRDWQLSFTHPQVLDGIERKLGDAVGIDEDYMTTRLPRVSDEEAAIALKAIQTLSRTLLQGQ